MRWHERLRRYFVDLRFMTGLMCGWLCAVVVVLMELEVFSRSKFIAFGPRPDLNFMHVSIDTYYKYNMLIAMIIIHTFITDIISDSLGPHVLNVVQDTRNKYIPHKAFTYYFITTAWSVYCAFTQLFVIFIAFAQLDLLLFRLASDLLANAVTLSFYLDGKIFDPTMHAKTSEEHVQMMRRRRHSHEHSSDAMSMDEDEDESHHHHQHGSSCDQRNNNNMVERGPDRHNNDKKQKEEKRVQAQRGEAGEEDQDDEDVLGANDSVVKHGSGSKRKATTRMQNQMDKLMKISGMQTSHDVEEEERTTLLEMGKGGTRMMEALSEAKVGVMVMEDTSAVCR